ncbi:MAG: hypothetical protein JWR72_3270 [Flavisolibacter sp.]|jgi:hypothetical protein|nr:hypothetical protein [Flavisolibacter sp.]
MLEILLRYICMNTSVSFKISLGKCKMIVLYHGFSFLKYIAYDNFLQTIKICNGHCHFI